MLSEAESEAVVRRLLESFESRAGDAVDELLADDGDPNRVLRLAGLEEAPPGGFIPSRDVLVSLVTGLLLAQVDLEEAPEQAREVVTRLSSQVYMGGMKKMADEAAARAQELDAAALSPDPTVEQAIARPGVLSRRAERVLRERGYVLSNVGTALWSIKNTRSNQEVGIVPGDAATALGWLYQHAWPEAWIESIQPDLGRPQVFTKSEVAQLLQLGLVGVFHSSGPDGEARGVQYFIEGHTDGKIASTATAKSLLVSVSRR